MADSDDENYASPSETTTAGEKAAKDAAVLVLKTERKTAKASLTRTLNDTLALIRKANQHREVALKREDIMTKFAELRNVHERLCVAQGVDPDSDPDEYMANVQINLDEQIRAIDAYLASVNALTVSTIPESIMAQLVTRSREEMLNLCREELANELASGIANEGQQLLKNQTQGFEDVHYRIGKVQEDARKEQERFAKETKDLIKGLEKLILARLQPEPQAVPPPANNSPPANPQPLPQSSADARNYPLVNPAIVMPVAAPTPHVSAPPITLPTLSVPTVSAPRGACVISPHASAYQATTSARGLHRPGPGWHVSANSNQGPDSPHAWSPNHSHASHGTSAHPFRHSLFRRPKIDIEPFDGDPQTWPRFISAFDDMIQADSSLSTGDKMRLLKGCLTDRIKDSLGMLLEDPNLYDDAIEELSSTYGNPLLVSRAIISKIRSLPKVQSISDFPTLHRLSTTLRGAVATLQSGGFTAEVNSGSLLELVLEKLPHELRSQWGQNVIQVYPTLLTLKDLDQWLHRFVKGEMVVRQSLHRELSDRSKPRRPDGNRTDTNRPKKAVLATFTESSGQVKPSSKPCPACQQPHRLDECSVFKSMTLDKRADFVRENRSCLRCLKSGHLARQCSRKKACGVGECKQRHHSLLHGAPRIHSVNHSTPSDAESDTDVSTKHVGASLSDHVDWDVALTVVPITVINAGARVDTLAVLDSGAEISLIAQPVANALKLKGPSLPLAISTLTGSGNATPSISTSVVIASRDTTFVLAVPQVRVVPELNLQRRVFDWPRLKTKWPHLAALELPKIDYARITVLLGRDVRVHSALEEIHSPAGSPGPDAVRTPFGWAVVGPLYTSLGTTSRKPMVNMTMLLTAKAAAEIRENLGRLFDDFALGTAKPSIPKRLSTDELRAAAILKATTRHLGDRYEVGLLWRNDDVHLPNNHSFAVRLFSNQERRFARDAALAARYHTEMMGYISEGYAIELTPAMEASAKPGRIWYIPHHGVTSPSKPGKLRLVFNCSSSFQGVSLNGNLLKGPDLLTNLFGILLRAMAHPVLVSADIKAMYHQVAVPPEDQSALRFVYRTPGSHEPLKTFQMTRHVFGAASSPTACIYALQQAGRDADARHPGVADLFKKWIYVDNLIFAVDTDEEAAYWSRVFIQVCQDAGFSLRQFIANRRQLMEQLEPDRLLRPELSSRDVPLPVEKMLGVWIDWETDEIVFRVSVGPARTMRELLRELANIHDPLGFLSVTILMLRVLLQDCWRLRLTWDQPLPESVLSPWNEWMDSSRALAALRIPRCMRQPGQPLLYELHTFTDASTDGFAACCYLRTVYSGDAVHVRLVCAKSRVAPVRQQTIPRLELQGATLGSQLAATVADEIDLPALHRHFWTDSVTVLSWLTSTACRYHAFVANRVTTILENSNVNEWRHVPGSLNPADEASRGILPAALHHEHRWFRGPAFLWQPHDAWPTRPIIPEPARDDPEVCLKRWIGAVTVKDEWLHSNFARFSSLLRLQRSYAYVLRYVRILRQRVTAVRPPIGDAPTTPLPSAPASFLSPFELNSARKLLIRLDQAHFFPCEIVAIRRNTPLPNDSKLHAVTPMLDSDNVLRVSGRLARCDLPDDFKHPIILHHGSHLGRLVIKEVHERFAHASLSRTISELRSEFYILRFRHVVRQVITRCPPCRRVSARPVPPLMAALPPQRAQAHLPPFSFTGIDYFGPYEVVILRRTVKRWIVLFTCLTTRAVHLEVAHTMDTHSFLLAFFRFTDRRGLPAEVWSDNGTNLTRGELELRAILADFDQTSIGSQLASRQIKWTFSPPAAPHFGGIWERLVQSAKAAMRAVLRNRTLTDEVLLSVVTGAESLLNGRPLTHISVNPLEPGPLTPNHFLMGRPNPTYPPDLSSERPEPSLKTWRAAQTIISHFWRRWLREYVPNLIERRKWVTKSRNIQPGDVVLLADPNSRRGEWPIGRIIRVFPGPDGVVRSATVKTATGEYHRPVTKLCLLETSPPDVSGPETGGADVANASSSQASTPPSRSCGSCWAFAAVTPVEYALCKRTNAAVSLSEQQIVSCDLLAWGCDGGGNELAWRYMQTKGLATSYAYPYTSGRTSQNGTCVYKDTMSTVKVATYGWADPNHDGGANATTVAQALLKYGPLGTGLAVINSFFSYSSGVYDDPACNNVGANHAVVIVGFGTSVTGIPYWIVRNSWGLSWGQHGYFTIRRGVDRCHIEYWAEYITIV